MKDHISLKETTKRVNKKAFIAIIISIIFGLLTLCTSYISSNISNKRASLIKEGNNLKKASDNITNQTIFYCLTGDQKYYDNMVKEVNEDKGMEKAIDAIVNIGVTDKEKSLIYHTNDMTAKLAEIEDKAIEYVKKGDLKTSKTLILGNDYEGYKSQIDKDITDFQTSINARAKLNNTVCNIVLFIFCIITIALMLFVFYIMLIYAKFIDSDVINPIITIKKCLNEISVGNLNVDIPIEEDDTEIGVLSSSLKNTQNMLKDYISDISYILSNMSHGDMTGKIEREYLGDFFEIKESINGITDSLNTTLKSIDKAANEVAQGAEYMSNSSMILSEGSCEQASSIEELSTTINHIHIKTEDNAKASEDVSNIVNSAANKISLSNEKMSNLVNAMGKIREKSNEISNIINTINSIAHQTNILAINTSIESARAGVLGKQFSVIAEEVRQLALHSAEAVNQTSALIDETILAVEDGDVLAKEASDMLYEIVNETNKMTDLIETISIASNNQATSTAEINRSVEEMSASIQTNSSAVQENSATSQELASQAQFLKESISQFNLA